MKRLEYHSRIRLPADHHDRSWWQSVATIHLTMTVMHGDRGARRTVSEFTGNVWFTSDNGVSDADNDFNLS
ncbi:hypothetical protein Pelo_6651 [Pelomyxa schiedti]|nr:hypothetical protein Pelo_6651 [Pelomyxa schiedti]